MTNHLRLALDSYARDVSRLSTSESTTEASHYPAIKTLLEAALAEMELRLEVRASTSEARRSGGRDAPDFAVYDGAGGFVMLYVEVKNAEVDIRDLAMSRENNDQIGRYLGATGAVLLCTIREIAVVTVDGRRRGGSVAPTNRTLSSVVELWPTISALRVGARIPDERGVALAQMLEDALTRHTPIASPETLARVLARQARRAAGSLPVEFTSAVATLHEDFSAALGISFEGDEGEHFFRSSLIQTVYYGMFAGWLLHASEWRLVGVDSYDWRRTGEYLRIPFLAGLFHEIRNPVRLRELGLRAHLETAAATLARVDKPEFFRRLRPIATDGSDQGFNSAIVYFYEPFLAAFDPALRDELGVWYTPPEIVRYQVRRVDRLLRDELGCPRGLADENVVVLDPACGTGAYLIETLRCIAETLREEGVGAELAATLRAALEQRILGFEILTAPFVVAHLQLYLMLLDLGAPPDETHRAGVFLTNALTGWHEAPQVALHFPELQQERDAAQRVKRSARIVVVIGNPPYNRFIGVPVSEEEGLVDRYKGITRDDRAHQIGQSELWSLWGIRKQLLDDLYVRFFRLAEECIGTRAEFGIVSFISNSSFLTGRSHPIMRESLLGSFDAVWIDNLHGNRLANERTPWGGSCDTVFSTGTASGGIKVGTAITTWLKRSDHVADPSATRVFSRDFWGDSGRKRQALIDSLDIEQCDETERAALAAKPEGPRPYSALHTDADRRWKLLPYDVEGSYEEWPSLEELFPLSSPGVNPNRGLDDSVVDTDRQRLETRMREYFSVSTDEALARRHPALMTPRARYDAGAVRQSLRASGFSVAKIIQYQLFPLDSRFIYYEPSHKLLNEPRAELGGTIRDNEFLVIVNESRRTSETKPLLSRSAFDLHLFDVGAQAFFAERRERIETVLDIGEPEYRRIANISSSAWNVLSTLWHLKGDLYGDDAKQLVRTLFRVALAVGHSPAFQRDFIGSLTHEWLHLPIPRDRVAADRAAKVGSQVATLLDPLAEPQMLSDVIHSVLGSDATRLAVITSTDGRSINEDDLRVDIAYFGSSRGAWRPRNPAPTEPWDPGWGEITGDLWLNDRVFLSHVPQRAWRHELGGYQVIKKWLGYREGRRRAQKPLTFAEKDHLRSMVQRLSALAVLEKELDKVYVNAAADAFTTEDLGLTAGP